VKFEFVAKDSVPEGVANIRVWEFKKTVRTVNSQINTMRKTKFTNNCSQRISQRNRFKGKFYFSQREK